QIFHADLIDEIVKLGGWRHYGFSGLTSTRRRQECSRAVNTPCRPCVGGVNSWRGGMHNGRWRAADAMRAHNRIANDRRTRPPTVSIQWEVFPPGPTLFPCAPLFPSDPTVGPFCAASCDLPR